MEVKIGFELLRSRSKSDIVSFTELEASLEILMPPLFKLFHESFKVDLERKNFYYRNKNEERPFLSLKQSGFGLEDLGVNEFVSYEQLNSYNEALNYYRTYDLPEGEVNYFYENLLLPICNCEQYNRVGGGIGVGTKGNNIDKIILIKDPQENQYEIIAENVFEFIRGFESFVAWDDIETSLLYKNYNEDFWRLRD